MSGAGKQGVSRVLWPIGRTALFGRHSLAAFPLNYTGGLVNRASMLDPEIISNINHRYNRPVTDDYGDQWTKGGIDRPIPCVATKGTVVARFSEQGHEQGAWVIEVPDAQKILKKGSGAFAKELGIAGSVDPTNYVVTIFVVDASVGLLAGPGLPVGNDWNYTHVDFVSAPSSDITQYYIVGINDGEASPSDQQATRKALRRIAQYRLRELAGSGGANLTKYADLTEYGERKEMDPV